MANTIRMIQGDDDINAMLNKAMAATVEKMANDRLISPDEASHFLTTNACILATGGGLGDWLRRAFGGKAEDRVVIAEFPHAAGQHAGSAARDR